jgi:hypothetical protein
MSKSNPPPNYRRLGDDEVRVAHALQIAKVVPDGQVFDALRKIAAQYPDMRMRAFVDACLLAQMGPIEIEEAS